MTEPMEPIDPNVLEAWALDRVKQMRSPIARAIYAGLATRATRRGGFDVRPITSNMDEPSAGAVGDKEK